MCVEAEVNTCCLPQLLSTRVFEAGSLTRPSVASKSPAPRTYLCPPPKCLAFLWCWVSTYRYSYFNSKHLIYWVVFKGPQKIIILMHSSLVNKNNKSSHTQHKKKDFLHRENPWLGRGGTSNPSTQEEEAGGPLSFKPAWSHSKTSKFKDNQKYGRPCLKGAGAEQL